jgi:excisionase family DNA binding protein
MNNQETPNDVLTTEEVAKILRCSKDTVTKLAKSGRLKSASLTTGTKKGLPRFLRKNVIAFLDGDTNEKHQPEPKQKQVHTSKPKKVQLVRHTFMNIPT